MNARRLSVVACVFIARIKCLESCWLVTRQLLATATLLSNIRRETNTKTGKIG
jgi:hypothetical protein